MFASTLNKRLYKSIMCIDKFWLKLSILTLISTIITNEFLIYALNTLSWPITNNPHNNVMNLLLVADPQIQGLYNEPQGIIGQIFIFDSDNYLRNTYNWALRMTEPHAVLFLGDLIDEGIKQVLTFDYLNKDIELDKEELWRVGMTHFPLHMNNPEFSEFVRDRLRPDLVLSGHLHFGLRILRHRDTWMVANKSYTKRFDRHNKETIQFNLHQARSRNELLELVVPTCSYRMGMPEMAFGLLHFNGESGEVIYNNLWLPQRFFWLNIYGYSCGLIALMLVVGLVKEQRMFDRLADFIVLKKKNKKQY